MRVVRQTTFVQMGQTEPAWHHVDASGQVLGRMATRIATVLMGKHRPEYTPFADCGDIVVVTNAREIVLTGRKAEQKMSLRYSGHPGGLKARSYATMIEQRPEQLVEDAVRRMLPKNRLGRVMMRRLKVYAGAEHPHQSNQPVTLEV